MTGLEETGPEVSPEVTKSWTRDHDTTFSRDGDVQVSTDAVWLWFIECDAKSISWVKWESKREKRRYD